MARFFLYFIDRIVCYRNFPFLDFFHNGFVQFAFVFPCNEKTAKFVSSFITWATLIKPTSIIRERSLNFRIKQIPQIVRTYVNIFVIKTVKFFFCVFADVIKLFCTCTLYRHCNDECIMSIHRRILTIFMPMCQDNYMLWICI